ncbi:MAG: nitroreductase family protein [Clostridiales bacterium]|nr:nitroreductase family protein [Clostridiales bacterium]
MNLYEAMFVRKSVRDYSMEALDDKTLEHIKSYLTQLKPYKTSIAYEIKIVDAQKDGSKLKGMFHVKAPYYILFSSELKTDYLINAGYILHQLCLYLTARNIGCCYQGGIHPTHELKDELTHDYVIALAFGKSPKSIYRPANKARRLDEDSLIVYKEEVDENVKNILHAAVLSPSSMNNQPWRFVVYHNRIHLFCKKARFLTSVLSDSKLIDMGVVLASMAQAADELWMDATLVKAEAFQNKQLKNTEYITTFMLKDKVF